MIQNIFSVEVTPLRGWVDGAIGFPWLTPWATDLLPLRGGTLLD